MNISAINSTSPAFSGTYRVNINQTMPNGKSCFDRDLMLGAWLNEASNGDEIYKTMNNFMKNDYNEDKFAPCFVEYEIPNSKDEHFETCMKQCGQKFERVA